MSEKNNKLASVLIGPALIFGGILALWENEGRFNYYEAAKDTLAIASPSEHTGEPISLTGELDTTIPIQGDYIEQFDRYHRVRRRAEIYSWEESTDSEGHTTWSQGWHSSLESNSRNRGLSQRLSSTTLYPPRYQLGDLEITPERIHFADSDETIALDSLNLTPKARSMELVPQSTYLYLHQGRTDNLGDERVSYTGIPNTERATYFGRISGDIGIGKQFEFNSGIISSLIANDGILHHLVNGERELALEKIQADFNRVVWITRMGGTLVIVFGILIFLSAFMSLLYRLPLIGGWVESGVVFVSFSVGLPIALSVILMGWIFHNPWTVALPLALMIGGMVYLVRRSRATQKNARSILSQRADYAKTQSSHRPESSRANTNFSAFSDPAGSATEASEILFDTTTPSTQSDFDPMEQTFINLVRMALAEGGVDKKEQQMLVNWGLANGIQKERMKALFDLAKQDRDQVHPASRHDLELLACMALIDGELSRSEWKILANLALRLGISAIEVRQMINDIESGRLEPWRAEVSR